VRGPGELVVVVVGDDEPVVDGVDAGAVVVVVDPLPCPSLDAGAVVAVVVGVVVTGWPGAPAGAVAGPGDEPAGVAGAGPAPFPVVAPGAGAPRGEGSPARVPFEAPEPVPSPPSEAVRVEASAETA